MTEIDWYRIKFLESAENIKRILTESIGREPSTRIATEISACLQQGRMFFQAASKSPIEIRPLQIFYGIIGFSKAIILARNLRGVETLIQRHGLKDISTANDRIENFKLMILKNGTFQEFNDVISKLDRVNYFGKYSTPLSYKIQSDDSSKIIGKKIAFKEILARIPGLEELYESTFMDKPKNCGLSVHYMDEYGGLAHLRVDDPEIFRDRESIKEIVQKWRTKHPFLENWCFYEAIKAWGGTILYFANIDKSGIDEFSEEFLIEGDGKFKAKQMFEFDLSYKRIDFRNILPPLSGGGHHMIEAYEGAFISEYSLHYLGMFLLSSLVRYRPQIWSHAIRASVTGEKPADDKALALIEKFMDLSLGDFPVMTAGAMLTN